MYINNANGKVTPQSYDKIKNKIKKIWLKKKLPGSTVDYSFQIKTVYVFPLERMTEVSIDFCSVITVGSSVSEKNG